MTISETANANYNATAYKVMTAYDMALTEHKLSPDATYARTSDGALWIWSDRRQGWVQIDFESKGMK
jgi:hypothetical protein